MLWYRYFGYAIFYAAGFRIKIIGKQATRKEAPVLVGAPHSSFLEVIKSKKSKYIRIRKISVYITLHI